MTGDQGTELDAFLDASIQKAGRIEQALGHLAKAIELGLVDAALDPTVTQNGSREKFVMLGQKLAEISGISYELVRDISETAAIPIESVENERATDRSGQPVLPAQQQLGPVLQPAPTPEPFTPPPAASAATVQEACEAATERDLYGRIIDPTELPEMRPVEAGEAVTVSIVDEKVVQVGEHKILLAGHQLFIFNALLLLRDKPRAAGEIKALGFAVDGKNANTAFSQNMKPLIEVVNHAAGKEIIKKLGDKSTTRYAVNPKLVLEDLRESVLSSSGESTDVKKN